MKPPTISFPSAKGPSVAPEAVTTLPDGFSWLPISRMLGLNFSFHPLKAANISCICAGDGLALWLGAPRYMHRYFLVGIGFSSGFKPIEWGVIQETREERRIGHLKNGFSLSQA